MNFAIANLGVRIFAIACLLGLYSFRSLAGELPVLWDAVPQSDIAGYRVYYNTKPVEHGDKLDRAALRLDTDNVTSLTISGLTDCKLYYVAVKARDTGGLLSQGFSNQIGAYPLPRIVSVKPSSLLPGESAQVVISGTGFAPGASASFTNVRVDSTSVDRCGRMTVKVTVPPEASGTSTLTVTNVDGGQDTLADALTMTGGRPTFSATSSSPGAGATDVDAASTVRITFSHPLDPATVTSTRFRIVGAGAARGAILEAGSPSLDEAGTTVSLTVRGMLSAGGTYRVHVKGGRLGVRDREGASLAASYVQAPGFSTRPLVEGVFYGPSGSTEAPPPLQPLTEGAMIPAGSSLVVRFTEPMSPASVNAHLLVLKSGAKRIGLEGGAPTLSADGLSATIQPAEPLAAGSTLTLVVRGGGHGIVSNRGVTMRASPVTVRFTAAPEPISGLGAAD